MVLRYMARSALRDLDLDYVVTLISGGRSRNYEIVMWDKPRDSYFTIHVKWDARLSRERMTQRVTQQLTSRLAALRAGDASRFDERRPSRYGRGSTADLTDGPGPALPQGARTRQPAAKPSAAA